MARQEIPREDLLRDARALVHRGELRIDGLAEHAVIGFRQGGAASVYFGEDPALHFTSAGLLRRAFIDGDLYKAIDGRLVRMRRVRVAGEVQLQSAPLAEEQQRDLLARLAAELSTLNQALAAGRFTLVGEVPTEGRLVDRSREWLERTTDRPLRVADAPGVA